MILSKVNWSPPQVPLVLALDWIQASAVRGWLLTTGPQHSPIKPLHFTGHKACSSVLSATALQNVCVPVTAECDKLQTRHKCIHGTCLNVWRESVSYFIVKKWRFISQMLIFPENGRSWTSVMWYTTSSHIQQNMVTVTVRTVLPIISITSEPEFTCLDTF
jgi:hypothetical protein